MTANAPSLEPAIQRIGRQLAERSASRSGTIFDSRWWTGTLLDWCMKDQRFKVQLFRFVDVLPSLQNDDQVVRLMQEYFGEQNLPSPLLQWGMQALSATRLGARLTAKSLRHHINQMAHTFIAGASIEKALPVLSRRWATGRACSVDLLGEATVSEREADEYRDRCLEALTALHQASRTWAPNNVLEADHLGALPRVNLSVKLSALYSQLDPIDPEDSYEGVAQRLRPILDLAMTLPAGITFDMEQAETKDLTLMIFTRLLSEPPYRSYPHGGIAMQAYLKRTGEDLDTLIRWARQRGTPVGIRLVKGAYWDSETIRYKERGWPVPLFENKAETDANYEQLTRVILNHTEVLRPAFGSHNLRSLAHVHAAAEAAGLPPAACEYQMIFGMAEPLQAAVVEEGRRVRIYTPVGELLPGMAYLVRRLLENTSNESFLRKEYVESEPLEALLAPPRVPAARTDQGNRPVPCLEPGSAEEGWEPFTNEPHTDFSLEAPRKTMAQAIAAVKTQLGRAYTYPLPKGVSPSGAELVSRNPAAPKQEVGRLGGVNPADLTAIIQSAQAGLGSWSATPTSARRAILVKAADLMRQRRFELCAWEIFETGKPWREADADLAEAIDFLTFYAREMHRLDRPRRLGREPGELNHLVYAPRGLAAVIPPWNFPLAIPTGMVSAALVTGNVVLFKPSERAPLLGRLLVDLLTEAGLPQEALYFVPGGPEVGRALVAHPSVNLIVFTGSKEVGLHILAQASQVGPTQRTTKRVIAEMGGKNAIIVDDTADLDEAVTGVMASFTGYQGQKCSACSRAIVHEAVHDQFLKRLIDAVLSLRIGSPEDPGTSMGPMIDERAREKVREYLDIGRQEGRLVVERSGDGDGYFIGPAVFAEIRPTCRLAQEEIFGPVLAVLRATDFEDALEVANSTPYALTGGVYSRSPRNILAARERFDVGNLYINRPITGALVGRQPFGGHRLSGVGAKAGGPEYLTQFMVAKVISENTLRQGFAPTD